MLRTRTPGGLPRGRKGHYGCSGVARFPATWREGVSQEVVMEIAAGLFKAQCLKLMDRVAERHETITVTKRGKAMAQLVPVAAALQRPQQKKRRGLQ